MLHNITSTAIINGQILLSATGGSLLHFDKRFLIETGIQVFNIIVLTIALICILYAPVRQFLRNRTERIQNDIVAAKSEYQTAQDLKEEYHNKLAEIDQEREEILNQARKKAIERSDQILTAAKKEADTIYHNAMAEIAAERINSEADTKRQLIELSTLIAERFIEVSIDTQTQEKFVDEALAGWEEDLWRN
ncbi:F0F1 ATP synthase subunit B [Anaeropeptidivorans aminofermentans]|uniref:F0F1 ATP synthase subunit B n=1 Tax=Anaeropeptidivorans aminofermentans TaxID=2934315 RepID=UPI0020250CD2|nr:F0F1 ATP synthase subunit B [Anaeropeptidivorans aminofermentans]